MLKPHSINSLENFIGGWYLDDLSICDELIQAHKNSPYKFQGKCNGNIVDVKIKDSTDCSLSSISDFLYLKYDKELKKCSNEYMSKYPMSNFYAPWKILTTPNIQHYKPKQTFHEYHTERYNANSVISTRHLVFMTYLNDVFDGGETEFFHQKLKVKPEKGLTLIWPTDWTFTHRGVPSLTEEKYIVTGWFNFY
jgi:hypothetical protein